jgi:hypothetical protein
MLQRRATGSRSMTGILAIAMTVIGLLVMENTALAEQQLFTVTIAEPYIDIHTQPGRGYPVFYIAERGERLSIIKSKNEWYKVRTQKDIEGWVYINDLGRTLDSSGSTVNLHSPNMQSFTDRTWEAGFMAGDFNGSDVITLYGGYQFTRNLSVEVALSENFGNFSDGQGVNFSIVHQMFPSWRFSPYFTIGGGLLQTNPKSSLIATEDRDDNFATVGGGLKVYLARRFLLRLQYKNYIVLTNRDDDEEIDEWKIGLSVFY